MKLFRKSKKPLKKWSVKRICERYDAAAWVFEQHEQGQPEIVDASVLIELVVCAADKACPQAEYVLDVGCGAGLYALSMLELNPELSVTLVDLSENMLESAYRAVAESMSSKLTKEGVQDQEELTKLIKGRIKALQGDVREIDFGESQYDIALAGASLHHLREESEWELVFENLYRALKPGGSLWIADVFHQENPAVQAMMWQRYADYLETLKGQRYSRSTLKYIEREDSPRSLMYQLELLRDVGFSDVEVLHVNTCFGAFGGVRRV